ncbi:hypothetical protein Nepgr_014415 [Nepenthes gracilis]|uniref:DOMON domain-containing protein n=1 Tax=Nepenthes gracilis TaxID=150966 RepID=A0AAD3SKT7_NEPGR|nr:hypothetical protein Nepgr_014415 [Nepenthes gracilis]
MVQIAYRDSQTTDGWIAWAINPTGTGMLGSQALVAFDNRTTGVPVVYSTPVTSYAPLMQPATLSFPVSNLSAEYSNGEMVINRREYFEYII